jgi:16S rRNA processing protein RimM
MPGREDEQDGPWVRVARSVTLRGPQGLLTARTEGQAAGALVPGKIIRLAKGASSTTFRLMNAERYRDRVILKLEGIDSAALAGPLAGSDIYLQSKDLVDLPEGTYYIFRLVGLEVFAPGNRRIGRVKDVLRTGGTDLLLVQGESPQEILIPFARSICRRIDIGAGIIEIDPPPGLLEIDAI